MHIQLLRVLHRETIHIEKIKKLCENDPDNWGKYITQVLTSYHVIAHLATAETTFFIVCGRDPNLSLQQLLEPMQ